MTIQAFLFSGCAAQGRTEQAGLQGGDRKQQWEIGEIAQLSGAGFSDCRLLKILPQSHTPSATQRLFWQLFQTRLCTPSSCCSRFVHPLLSVTTESTCPRGRLLGCHTEPHRGDLAGAGVWALSSFGSEVQEHKPSKLHLCHMAQRWPHTNKTHKRPVQETTISRVKFHKRSIIPRQWQEHTLPNRKLHGRLNECSGVGGKYSFRGSGIWHITYLLWNLNLFGV